MEIIAEEKGITYPESLISRETKDLMTGYMQHLKYAAMGSGYMTDFREIDLEKAEIQARTQALHDLNEDTIIKGIIQAESIEVSTAELEKEALRISREQGTSIEMVKRFFGEDFAGLTEDIKKQKARKLIYDTAKRIQ